MICFNWKEAIWSLTKKKTRKQERKANKIITLDGKNTKKVKIIILNSENHKAAPNEKPTDSPQWSFTRSSI